MNPISQLPATSHQRAATGPLNRRAWVEVTGGRVTAERRDSERSPGMTPDAPKGGAEAARQDAVGRFRAAVARLTACVHAAGDERAHAAGWTVTATTGRLGLSARTYRDPRFGPPAPARPSAALRECPPAVGAPHSGPATRAQEGGLVTATRETWPAPATREARPAAAARGWR